MMRKQLAYYDTPPPLHNVEQSDGSSLSSIHTLPAKNKIKLFIIKIKRSKINFSLRLKGRHEIFLRFV